MNGLLYKKKELKVKMALSSFIYVRIVVIILVVIQTIQVRPIERISPSIQFLQ